MGLYACRRTQDLWAVFYVFPLTLVLAAATSADERKTLQGKVTQVAGQHCKMSLSAENGLQVNARGRLHRQQNDEGIGELVVTLVKEDYSVGLVSGAIPMIGDVVVISPPGLPRANKPLDNGTSAGKNDSPLVENTDSNVDDLDTAIDAKVDVELKSGLAYHRTTLLRVVRDTETGQVTTVQIEHPETGKKLTLGATAITRVMRGGREIYRNASAAQDDVDPARKTRNQLLADARREREEEEHQKWLARLEVRGVKPWPVLSDDEHQATVDKYKQFTEEIGKAVPGMTLHETRQFLVYTNIPAEQIQPYIVSLDNMHEMMCKMYRIGKSTRVWRGKALVVAFLYKEQFQRFEAEFMRVAIPDGVYGLCHQKSNGEVVMACYRGDRQEEFGQMLVHETSHGFIHRYKTPERFPNWVNEGMADWIGLALVPTCKSVKLGEAMAIARLKETRSMGGDFFTRQNIDGWQYGLASNLADFMIRTDKDAYVKFIEGMKEGLTWEESLKASYNATPQQLVATYGRAIGVPDLRP